MEAEHANCHHSLLTLPSANLAATSKVAHSCIHHILSLQQYCIEGIFQHVETVQYVATVQTLLQYVATPTSLQYCSIAKLMQKLQSPGARIVRSVWAGASTVGKANACYGGLRSDETNMLCNFSSFTFTLDQDMYA